MSILTLCDADCMFEHQGQHTERHWEGLVRCLGVPHHKLSDGSGRGDTTMVAVVGRSGRHSALQRTWWRVMCATHSNALQMLGKIGIGQLGIKINTSLVVLGGLTVDYRYA